MIVKKSRVIYTGTINELKSQLNFIRDVHPMFKGMITDDELNHFSNTDNTPKTMYERIEYTKKGIIYGPNGSPMETKYFIINHYSTLADKKFIEKNGKNSLEVIVKE